MRLEVLGLLACVADSASGLAITVTPTPTPSPLPTPHRHLDLIGNNRFLLTKPSLWKNTSANDWQNMKCGQVPQGVDPSTQWNATGADAAWTTTLDAWQQNPVGAFPEFVSSRLHGPIGMRCFDISSENACAQPVQCQNPIIPAGSQILTGFVGIHQAIQTVQANVTNQIGVFTSTFSPLVHDSSHDIKMAIDVVQLITTFGASLLFNTLFKLGTLATDMGHEMIATSIGSAGTFYKENMNAINPLDAQNGLSSFLGQMMSRWQGIEADYLDSIFSGHGENGTTTDLYNQIKYGAMLPIINELKLTDTLPQVEKVVYGQLIQAAWKNLPDGSKPFIWASGEACGKSFPSDISRVLPTDVAVKANVCQDGQWFFVLSAPPSSTPGSSSVTANALPGGDHKTLDGSQWGGVILEDIVASSVGGFKKFGGNSYTSSAVTDHIFTDFGQQAPNIRDPGFFSIRVCQGSAMDMQSGLNGDPKNPEFPCYTPNYNSDGTNIFVNSGYIVINDSPRCPVGPDTPGYNVQAGPGSNSTATIYAKFDGSNNMDQEVTPGCKLQATWPANYGDLHYGQDDCLHDMNGKYTQCCTETTTDRVINPYAPGNEPHNCV
ncbi:uncharacterized protein ATNIH1004_000168 [Aspergillus tanneri]|uniref:Uncharacterized protein n=1 Tax=Aspergillus tanneri TaxID=1220188 RepID=A0A5M9N9I7_9EURO|nr:uncharacterized protein ATNIH1004_000168 [Aspergillus tanneri]KAA8651287.1 hypothetical protein ATNIH1004_000168 [Aspergillus tanneri]